MKEKIITAPKIKAPRGYKFRITRDRGQYAEDDKWDYVHVTLLNSKTNYEVGHIELEKDDNKWVTHSELNEDLRGQGIGIILYAKAIQYCHRKGWKVSSSGQSSDMAKRLWASKRLRKLFKIIKRSSKNRYWDYSIDDWIITPGEPTWYAYPLKKKAA